MSRIMGKIYSVQVKVLGKPQWFDFIPGIINHVWKKISMMPAAEVISIRDQQLRLKEE